MTKRNSSTLPIPRPTHTLLRAATLWLLGAIVASIVIDTRDYVAEIWAGAGALLALVLMVDYLVGWMTYRNTGNAGNAANISASRKAPHTVAVGVPCTIGLKITNNTNQRLRIDVYDRHPDSCLAPTLPLSAAIPAGRFANFEYAMTPSVRGDHFFGRIAARMASPLGFWSIPFDLGVTDKVRVFPNYAAVTRYALLAVDHRLSQIGVLKRQRRGEGMDFHQLRDYREGDSPRSIDWKATARHVKLITREYQDERDQQVLFLLDCSRRMNAKDGELSHFDHTLNAILLLTFVAIRQGDAAGLMTFGAETDRFLAPKKSPETVSRLLNALYPLEPTLKTPDYYQAALDLGKRLNKRALIIVLSNVRDEDEDGLGAAMAQLKRRHLVMFANLKEAALDNALHPPQKRDTTLASKHEYDRTSLLTFAAAAGYANSREKVIGHMRARGINMLDTVPEKLPIALVNRYLDMKQRGAF